MRQWHRPKKAMLSGMGITHTLSSISTMGSPQTLSIIPTMGSPHCSMWQNASHVVATQELFSETQHLLTGALPLVRDLL
jgi:hypothetical protein